MATLHRPISVADILSLLRELASASRAREYSRERYLYTTLLNMEARLPTWLVPAPVEPAAEVERIIADTRYRVGNEDGHLVLSISDGDDAAVLVLTDDEAGQLRADLQRVLAAMAAGKEAA